MFKKIRKLATKGHDPKHLYALATNQGLFDPNWYRDRYQLPLEDPYELFLHYLRKSKIDGKSPSASFNAQAYLNAYPDVAAAHINPLEHYLRFGLREGRHHVSQNDSGAERLPTGHLTPRFDAELNLKCAVTIHVFYEDFIARFSSALHQFPLPVDVFVTSPTSQILTRAEQEFSKIGCVEKIICKQTPNKGRNFGPLFVEFRKELGEYDLFCHMHSKKSLYTGREQAAWSDYLIEYLIQDKFVVRRMLQLFMENENLGVYFPRTFTNLPYWAHHWLKNYHIGKHLLSPLGVRTSNSFIRYPVGGMFWARPSAISQLLDRHFSYEDFPDEHGQTDGTLQHAIERSIGVVAEHNGFRQFTYDPDNNSFSNSHDYMWDTYRSIDTRVLRAAIDQRAVISFDVFDTVVSRSCTNPDYAKFQVGEVLVNEGVVKSAQEYVALRNQAELDIRESKHFHGDVTLREVIDKLSHKIGYFAGSQRLATMEMAFDLSLVHGRQEVIDAVHYAVAQRKKVIFLSDTYYPSMFIAQILRKAGVRGDFEIYVSSELDRRKDKGDIWEYILGIVAGGKKDSLLHVGDNLMSDIQMTADLGIMNFHLLSPLDKWRAHGLDEVYSFQPDDFSDRALFWGRVIDRFGGNPFFTERTS